MDRIVTSYVDIIPSAYDIITCRYLLTRQEVVNEDYALDMD